MVPLTSITERFHDRLTSACDAKQFWLPELPPKVPLLWRHCSAPASIAPRGEFRRAFPINDRARNCDVRKLLPIHCTAQHQSAAAHIATPNELRRKSQTVTKSCQ